MQDYSEYMLAPCLRKISLPWTNGIGVLIGKRRFPPNLFTMISLLWAVVSGVLISWQQYLLGSIFVLITGIWDGIDGSVARVQGKSTGFGNYLDAMIDKYVEVIIYSGFALGGHALEAFCVISGTLILSYTKPRAAMVTSIDNHDWPAIGDRADRFVLLLASLILSSIWPVINLAASAISTTSMMLYLIAVVVYVGGIQRVFYAKRIIHQQDVHSSRVHGSQLE
jgi:archaetidylinositol phosphate synthase